MHREAQLQHHHTQGEPSVTLPTPTVAQVNDQVQTALTQLPKTPV